MIYVMSDLHGEYDKFINMLNLINFSSSDTLYILGDVLDRGPKSLEIIDYIRKPENSNIKLLMGNHELFCILGLMEERYFKYWLEAGGDSTYKQLKERGVDYIYELLEYLAALPIYEIVNSFVLVHAGIDISNESPHINIDELMKLQNRDTLLWDREFISSNKYLDGYTVICGHTPTLRYMQHNKKASIIHRMGKILIDCGAHFSKHGGRLACLRLDDFKEFYID